ncbi:MAG: hypothetical protein H6733_01150 [Alphaproteobacteria bacterium]|nr:hypothetical protein [Alphaproteobacteria bacterium]
MTVSMPGTPEHRHADKAVFLGHVVSDTLLVYPEGGWCAVTVTQAPKVAMSMATYGTIFDMARKSVLEDVAATETGFVDHPRGTTEGRRLTFTTTKDSGKPQVGIADVYTWDAVVVTTTCTFHTDAATAARDRILASLTLP